MDITGLHFPHVHLRHFGTFWVMMKKTMTYVLAEQVACVFSRPEWLKMRIPDEVWMKWWISFIHSKMFFRECVTNSDSS